MIQCGPSQPYPACDSVIVSGQLCWGNKASCSVSEVSVKSLSVIEMSCSEVMLEKKKNTFSASNLGSSKRLRLILAVNVNETVEGDLALSEVCIRYSDGLNLVFSID